MALDGIIFEVFWTSDYHFLSFLGVVYFHFLVFDWCMHWLLVIGASGFSDFTFLTLVILFTEEKWCVTAILFIMRRIKNWYTLTAKDTNIFLLHDVAHGWETRVVLLPAVSIISSNYVRCAHQTTCRNIVTNFVLRKVYLICNTEYIFVSC